MLTTDNLLSQMRTKVLELYSPVIQLQIEAETDELKKKEFIEQRESCRYYLHELVRFKPFLCQKIKPYLDRSKRNTRVFKRLKR